MNENSFYGSPIYSENQITLELENDIEAIIKCILCCYKASINDSKLSNHLLSEMGLFTLHNVYVLCPLDYLKLILEYRICFFIPKFLVLMLKYVEI